MDLGKTKENQHSLPSCIKQNIKILGDVTRVNFRTIGKPSTVDLNTIPTIVYETIRRCFPGYEPEKEGFYNEKGGDLVVPFEQNGKKKYYEWRRNHEEDIPVYGDVVIFAEKGKASVKSQFWDNPIVTFDVKNEINGECKTPHT